MRSIFNEQFSHTSVIQYSVFNPFYLTQVPLYKTETSHDATVFTQMVGMTLFNFIKGNVDPTMLDKVQSIVSLDKPTIDTYAIGLFKLQSASSNDEHRQEQNHEENVHETAHNTADDVPCCVQRAMS